MINNMVAFLNPERKSTPRNKVKFLKHEEISSKLLSARIQSELGESDVTFIVERGQYHGHKRMFSAFSRTLGSDFEYLDNSAPDLLKPIVHGIVSVSRFGSSTVVDVACSSRTFEPVFHFVYSGELTISETLVPSAFILSKYLGIETLQAILADHLTDHIPVKNIGEICRVLKFSALAPSPPAEQSPLSKALISENRLTKAILTHLKENANAVVCSSTGQLGARLIVNITGEFEQSSCEQTYNQISVDDRTVLAVLLWAHERVVSGQRLARSGSEENVQSDDEESDGGMGSNSPSIGFVPQSKPPGEPTRLDVSVGLSRQDLTNGESNSQPDQNGLSGSANNSKCQLFTHDIRISLEWTALAPFLSSIPPRQTEETDEVPSDALTTPSTWFPSCSPKTRAEMETCLLASTSLGVGSTSIWLGKLVGHLVSLSIKPCHPCSTSSTPSSESSLFRRFFAQSNGRPLGGHGGSNGRSSTESLDAFSGTDDEDQHRHQQSHSEFFQHFEVAECEDFVQTVTAESASSLAKAAAQALSVGARNKVELRVHAPLKYDTEDECIRMVESRAGSGVGILSVTDKDFLVVAGGFARKGCLDSVELYAQHERHPGRYFSPPVRGPRLSKFRGRLALAQTSSSRNGAVDTLYACGGSTGSTDLSSVEKLTSSALDSWLSASSRPPSDDRPLRSSASQTTSECCVWQSVSKMHQPRSSPTAVGLHGLHTNSVVSDTLGSLAVLGGLAGTVALSSAEVFIPEKNQWVMLPNMREGRSEASCSLLPTKNLIVVAGGNSVPVRRNEFDSMVEGLDPRCANWMQLPSFNPGGYGKLRGAVLVPSPARESELLLIGGFNGQDTLDSVWVFDSIAWRWNYGTSLFVPRMNASAVFWTARSTVAIFGGFNATMMPSSFLDSIELICLDCDLKYD